MTVRAPALTRPRPQLPTRTAEQTYLSTAQAPGPARLFTRVRLTEWGVRDAAGEVEQVVSELVANAVQHGGGGEVTLRLECTPGEVVAYVGDTAPEAPVMRDAHPYAESGRGLAIIRLLSRRTGWYHPASGGKIVWAAVGRQ